MISWLYGQAFSVFLPCHSPRNWALQFEHFPNCSLATQHLSEIGSRRRSPVLLCQKLTYRAPKFDSEANLESCLPELRSAVSFIAPVEVVHALYWKVSTGKTEWRLRKISCWSCFVILQSYPLWIFFILVDATTQAVVSVENNERLEIDIKNHLASCLTSPSLKSW